MKKEKILIVGAGISGLYLSYLLEKKYDVTIVESRDRIGGRIHSINGHDMGPSWIWRHHQNMIDLVYEFGLELFFQYTDGYALYDTKNKVERFMNQDMEPSARVNGSLFKLIENIQKKLLNTKIILNEKIESIEQIETNIMVKSTNNNYISDYLISTLPPRLTQTLDFSPKFPMLLETQLKSTPTWMGNSMKCVVEFTKSFWKEDGLSGFVFSNRGPLGEIHDASTNTKNALFGFVNSQTQTDDIKAFKDEVKEQMIRLFDIEEKDILDIHLVNWRAEKYTSVKEDLEPLSYHPEYGIDTSSYSDKILFSSTEFSFDEGGYLEGAIINAKKVAQKLL